jgi:hypothetical protein
MLFDLNLSSTKICLLFLIFFGCYFLWNFCAPWFQVSKKLTAINRKIGSFNAKYHENLIEDLNQVFENTGVMGHIWEEYRDTLHKQTEIDSTTGQQRVVRIRLTVPAEAYFRSDVIVDTPLNADFFKHLPGILTGIGIIGTFIGILHGLDDFKIGENDVVQESLNKLLNGVKEAFNVSAKAISLAIIITFFEKIAITSLNRKVEKLGQLLNGLFEAGAGEEYLSRLVKSSEETTSQVALVKDAIVNDLKQILNDVTNKQITATQQIQSKQMEAQQILTGQQIEATNSLLIPLEKIRAELGGERADTGAAVQSMLVNVMTAFTEQIKDLFGDQLQNINLLQQETISALQQAVDSMNAMVDKFGAAGANGATEMAEILTNAMNAAETRQQIMNDKISEVLEQIKVMNAATQDSSSKNVEEMSKMLFKAMEENEIRQKSMNDRLFDVLEQIKLTNSSTQDSGSKFAEKIAEQLTEVMKEVESRQQLMNDKIFDVLEQIKITNTETQNSGTKSVEDMATKLSQAMEEADIRQKHMNEQMTILVDEIQNNIQSAQGETGIKLQETLDNMSSTMLSLINSVDGKVNVITGEGEKIVGEFGGQLNSLVDGVTLVVNEMKMAVDVMRQTTTEALTKMNAGANTLAGAANDFAQAGNGVSNTLEKSNEVAKGLREASVSLTTVSSGLNGVLDDYKLARSSMADLVDSMKVIVEQARKEANLTTDILLKFDNATQKLIAAQTEADNYLTKITEVIGASHGAFTSGMNISIDELRDGITDVVGKTNKDFHGNLTEAVTALKDGINDISEIFEEAAEKVNNAANKVSKK